MAKSIVLSILQSFLDKYLDGLTEDNLKIAVWSGEIELDNLSLKTDALKELHLPITVTRGYVGKIHVTIPWTALDSKPLQVLIDRVYLQACPIDVDTLSPEELRADLKREKHQRLEDIESEILKSFSESLTPKVETNKGFIESLTEKILDNLEVTVRRVHIRFEDSVRYVYLCMCFCDYLCVQSHNRELCVIRKFSSIIFIHTFICI